ncbi:hypothetical protein TSUD_118660 [Trifolium subterraneum]|uniref:Uncharacterized protein n=1 Tax=Trifolium subterraneum TaxID=3900 RepID=A0A2Z6N9A2_TRISU|nr:hypothetical protein TSUD_118660 [Trifolium subterraneum]
MKNFTGDATAWSMGKYEAMLPLGRWKISIDFTAGTHTSHLSTTCMLRAKISLSRCRDPNLPSRNKYEDMDALADIVNYCLTYGATTPGLVLSQEVAQLLLELGQEDALLK